MQRVTIPAFISKFLFRGGYVRCLLPAGRNMARFFAAEKGEQLTEYNMPSLGFAVDRW